MALISNKISESCMKDFLHAVDNHIHVLEENVKFHVEEEKLTHRKLYHSEMKMINNLGQIMRGYGNCTCNSSLIKIDGTRSSSLKKYMGPYQLAGVHQNMPYYVQANLGSNNQTMNQDQVFFFLILSFWSRVTTCRLVIIRIYIFLQESLVQIMSKFELKTPEEKYRLHMSLILVSLSLVESCMTIVRL